MRDITNIYKKKYAYKESQVDTIPSTN